MWPSGRNPSGAAWVLGNTDTSAADQLGHTVTNDYDGRPAPTTVTTTLMVTNVSIADDNGSSYRCAQGFTQLSDIVYLTVIGE